MKLFAVLAASLVLALWFRSTPDAQLQSGPAAPSRQQADRPALPQAAVHSGMSLAGFVDVWSGRPGGQVTQSVERPLPAPDAKQLMGDRIARFHEGRMRRAAVGMRPGDLAGLRAGDSPAQHVPTAESRAASRQRAEHTASRIERFMAARVQRTARAGANGVPPDGNAATPAALRPGDQVGPRAGELASLQRRYP